MRNLKFWQTKKFKELEKQWYEKLSRLGFEDQERMLNENWFLKQRASNSYRNISEVQREGKRLYFELLGKNFHDEKFDDVVEELIMSRRINGIKIKEICLELKSLKQRCHRETIRNIIQRYEKKWGIVKK